ncbi:MAG: hypothetical protein ABL973_20770 [Micropepsaceae bacterium]
MCVPIALTGLQIASSIAGAAAQSADQRRQAKQAEANARADAASANARGERLRDQADTRAATARVNAFTSGADPKSESVTASLAAAHARDLDGVRAEEDAARQSLYQGDVQSRQLRRAARAGLARSLIGAAETVSGLRSSGNTIYIPL